MSTKTLSELSSALIALDEEMDPEAFDPAALVGELRDKVDGIKFKIDEWEAQAKNLKENWLEPLTSRHNALLKKADKLREYCAYVMKRDELEMLPGKAFALKLRKSQAVEVDANPSPTEALQYGELVNTKITYAWDKKKLAEKLKANEDVQFARLVTTYSAQFVVKKEA